jgi:hypothetical protein
VQSIAKHPITRAALSTGTGVEDFNEMFNKLCTIVVLYVEEYIQKKEIPLNKQKLAATIIAKIQDEILEYSRCDAAAVGRGRSRRTCGSGRRSRGSTPRPSSARTSKRCNSTRRSIGSSWCSRGGSSSR